MKLRFETYTHRHQNIYVHLCTSIYIGHANKIEWPSLLTATGRVSYRIRMDVPCESLRTLPSFVILFSKGIAFEPVVVRRFVPGIATSNLHPRVADSLTKFTCVGIICRRSTKPFSSAIHEASRVQLCT